MKKIKFVNVIMLIFAIFAIFGGAYVFYRTAYAFTKTNGGTLVMAQEIISEEELSEYKQLKEDLEEKYLGLFCDVFAEAKDELLSRTEDMLGEEYKAIKSQAEYARKDLLSLADEMKENQEINALKDRLTELKEQLIKAPDQEKEQLKATMKEVLAEITRLNLQNFATLSKKRREIDALNNQIKSILDSKKDSIKDVEKEVLVGARDKLKQLVFAYGTEAEALAKAFGVTDYKKEPYFLSIVNPDLRLIDFDKNAMMDAVRNRKMHGHEHHHHDHHDEISGGCDHNCSACSENCDENNSVYNTKKIDKNDN